MVDPSVHPYALNLSESDESSTGSDFGCVREESSSCAYEEDAATPGLGKVHRSRSRTRRSSVNSAVKMNVTQRKPAPYHPEPQSSSASNSDSRNSSSSESNSTASGLSSKHSSSSESETMQSSPESPSNRKSLSNTLTATSNSEDDSRQSSPEAMPKRISNPYSYINIKSSSTEDPAMLDPSKGKSNSEIASSSEDEPMQSSPKPTSKGKSLPDINTGTSGSEDEPIQSHSNPISKGKSIYDENSETPSSEEEPMQSSPKPTSKGKSIYDTNTGTCSSEDEPIQSHSNPISKGKSIYDENSETSSSEEEPMQSSPKPTSKGKSIYDTNTGTCSSEDEPMQSHSNPISKGKSTLNTNSENSSSEEEPMQSSPKPTSKGKSIYDTNTGTCTSEDEPMQSHSNPISKGKSTLNTNSENSSSEEEPMQSSPKPTSKGKSIYDTNTGTCSSEDEPMQSSPKPTSKGKPTYDENSETFSSEEEPMQTSPKPTSKGKSIYDTNTGTYSSEDEPMQSLPKPTSKGKSIYDENSETFSSEEEPMQSSNKPTSKGKSFFDTNTIALSSEDEPMQSSPKPTSKGKSITDTNTGTSSSKDEPMQCLLKPTSIGKSIPNTNTLASEDTRMQTPPKSTPKEKSNKINDMIGLEEISSASISEDENERVVSKLSDILIDNETEKSVHNKNPETVEDLQRKALGDKLTAKFMVTLPEGGAGLIGGPLQFLRVPQFIPVESGAFDAETLKDCMTPDDLKDEQARGDFLNRLKTTVRWRLNDDKVKESNARIVRWSDGSETFHVGAEVFDVMHHKVIDDKNHLYVRLESCYQDQGSITDKMTLRPKLDSTFGQSHVQGLRNRTMNKPQTGVVKVLSDLVSNPATDRDRRAKEEIANLRREEREKRREVQMSMRKPRVKPMRHCTADDSDPEQPTGDQEDLASETASSLGIIGRSNSQGIRTNRNVAVNPGRLEANYEEDDEEEDGYNSDVNDIINDDDIDGDDEEMSHEPRARTSKAKMAPSSRHGTKTSDSDEGPKTRIVKRKTMRLVYSDSD